jgi:hypothetical protein
MKTRPKSLLCTILFTALITLCGMAQAQNKKPNILVLWGDDVGVPP